MKTMPPAFSTESPSLNINCAPVVSLGVSMHSAFRPVRSQNRRLSCATKELGWQSGSVEKEVTRSFVALFGLSFGVDQQRRRLVSDQILKLLPEILERHVDGGGKLCQLVRILEIIPAEPDHVTAGDGVADRTGVHEANAGTAGVAI